jgi:hypothetical protein
MRIPSGKSAQCLSAIHQSDCYREFRIYPASSMGGFGRFFSIQFIERRASLAGIREPVLRNRLNTDCHLAGRDGLYVCCGPQLSS